MFFEIFFGIEWGPGFEQSDIQAALGEHFGGSAAGGTRANDTNVIHFGRSGARTCMSPR